MSDQDLIPRVKVTEFDATSAHKVIDNLDKIESFYGSSQPVLVHIDSRGGAVAGLSLIYDKLMSMDNEIITYTSSVAFSAGAFLLSISGSEGQRFASPEADIMIHEIQSGAFGDIKEIEDRTNHIKTTNKKWLTILAKSMGLKNHKDVRQLINEKAIGMDIWLTAHQAKRLNLIDHVARVKVESQSEWRFVTK